MNIPYGHVRTAHRVAQDALPTHVTLVAHIFPSVRDALGAIVQAVADAADRSDDMQEWLDVREAVACIPRAILSALEQRAGMPGVCTRHGHWEGDDLVVMLNHTSVYHLGDAVRELLCMRPASAEPIEDEDDEVALAVAAAAAVRSPSASASPLPRYTRKRRAVRSVTPEDEGEDLQRVKPGKRVTAATMVFLDSSDEEDVVQADDSEDSDDRAFVVNSDDEEVGGDEVQVASAIAQIPRGVDERLAYLVTRARDWPVRIWLAPDGIRAYLGVRVLLASDVAPATAALMAVVGEAREFIARTPIVSIETNALLATRTTQPDELDVLERIPVYEPL